METILTLIADTVEQKWPKTEVSTQVVQACRAVTVNFRDLSTKVDFPDIKTKLNRLEEESQDKAEVRKFKNWVESLQRRLGARSQLTETYRKILQSSDSTDKEEHFGEILAVSSRIDEDCQKFGKKTWLPKILDRDTPSPVRPKRTLDSATCPENIKRVRMEVKKAAAVKNLCSLPLREDLKNEAELAKEIIKTLHMVPEGANGEIKKSMQVMKTLLGKIERRDLMLDLREKSTMVRWAMQSQEAEDVKAVQGDIFKIYDRLENENTAELCESMLDAASSSVALYALLKKRANKAKRDQDAGSDSK